MEVMTTAHVRAHGGRAERNGRAWKLVWPDGENQENVMFTPRDAAAVPPAKYLGLKDFRIRRLMTQLPPFLPGQPTPILWLPDLPEEVRGFWSLWKIAIYTTDRSWNRQRVIPLFLHDDGRCLLPTARYIWDQLLSGTGGELRGYLKGSEAIGAYERLREAIERQGRAVYEELVRVHREFLNREREKGTYAFEVRRKAIMWLGLPAVRAYRLAKLEEEENEWREQLEKKAEVMPELVPLLVVRVRGGSR